MGSKVHVLFTFNFVSIAVEFVFVVVGLKTTASVLEYMSPASLFLN